MLIGTWNLCKNWLINGPHLPALRTWWTDQGNDCICSPMVSPSYVSDEPQMFCITLLISFSSNLKIYLYRADKGREYNWHFSERKSNSKGHSVTDWRFPESSSSELWSLLLAQISPNSYVKYHMWHQVIKKKIINLTKNFRKCISIF